MRAGLCRHLDARAFGVADEPHAAVRRNVTDMHGHAEAFGKAKLARDAHVLRRAGNPFQPRQRGIVALVDHAAVGQLLILAVAEAFHTEAARVFHRQAHEAGARHRFSVVGDRHRARLFHLSDVRQLFAVFPFGDRADRADFAQPRLFAAMADIADHHLIVRDGLRVGHAANLREAPFHRRPRTAFNVLFILEARFSQMYVHVDQPGKHVQPRCVDHRLALFGRNRLCDFFDFSVRDTNVLFFHRVLKNHVSVLDNHFLYTSLIYPIF